MTHWGGASPGSGKGACGTTKSCGNPGYGCYCGAVQKAWREDSALLTEKSHLPVKQLSFDDTGDDEEDDYHTLEKLKRYGIA